MPFSCAASSRAIFRIDFSAAVLTEPRIAAFIGLADAERRGRVARAGLGALVERAFLQGAGGNGAGMTLARLVGLISR